MQKGAAMTAAISHATTAVRVASPPVTTQPASDQTPRATTVKAAVQAASSSTGATDTRQQQAALRQMLSQYSYDQSHGTDATTLAKLGRKITAAAKALGQHVTLPMAPAGEQSSASAKGKVNVTV